MSPIASPVDTRQTPDGNELYLDHAGWFVRDIVGAGERFGQLGFRLTPYTAHLGAGSGGQLELTGTGNRCVMLRRGYLEVLAAAEGSMTPLAQQHRAALAQNEGVHLLAFGTADPMAVYQNLKTAGFQPLPPILLERPIDDVPENMQRASFSVVRIPHGRMPEGRLQMVTHHSAELLWTPPLTEHANHVTELTGVLICADDVANAARRVSSFLGRKAIHTDTGMVIHLDRGSLFLAHYDTWGELLELPNRSRPSMLAAVLLRTATAAGTAAYLFDHGFPVRLCEGGSICVPAAAALGAALIMHEGPNFDPATLLVRR